MSLWNQKIMWNHFSWFIWCLRKRFLLNTNLKFFSETPQFNFHLYKSFVTVYYVFLICWWCVTPHLSPAWQRPQPDFFPLWAGAASPPLRQLFLRLSGGGWGRAGQHYRRRALLRQQHAHTAQHPGERRYAGVCQRQLGGGQRFPRGVDRQRVRWPAHQTFGLIQAKTGPKLYMYTIYVFW